MDGLGTLTLLGWCALLVVQNAAFTLVSRARNSASLSYHALASAFSNGIFFVSNAFVIGMVTLSLERRDLSSLLTLGLLYVASTVTGSVLMHYASMRWFEKGLRKVGAQRS